MKWDDIQQVVRILAFMVAGFLGERGGLDPANIETLGGAFLALASVAWWFFWNRKPKAE